MTDAPFGPWSPGVAPAERRIQLRCLQALVYVYCGMICDPRPCMEALRLAESGDKANLSIALVEFDRLPPLVIRKIVSVFGRVTWPAKSDIKKGEASFRSPGRGQEAPCATTGPRQKTPA